MDDVDAATGLHGHDPDLVARLVDELVTRLSTAPPLGTVRSREELVDLDTSVTETGRGVEATMDLLVDRVVPATLAIDHPGFWSFIGAAPSTMAKVTDALLGTIAAVGESWLEASGAVAAENAALRWLCDLCGFDGSAGGVFVSGGSAGNLSALAVAREQHTEGVPAAVVFPGSHSSISNALRILGIDEVDPDEAEQRPLCAVVATAGHTNTGVVDDLTAAAALAERHGAWFHVDGAYGGAALCVPEQRPRFAGIERADSVVIDPHKWLFSTLDCGALLWRDPGRALPVHRQIASYLDALQHGSPTNPADLAFHLTRRCRGLPFWASLVAHGTDAHTAAVRRSIELATEVGTWIHAHHYLELVQEPSLSIVLLRRPGWGFDELMTWSAQMLANGTAFVCPSYHDGEPVVRLCFVNPTTTFEHVTSVLETLADDA